MHWHVGIGIAGYGPDEPEYAATLQDAADILSWEAHDISEYMYEDSMILKESEMWADAWRAYDECETFSTLKHNLDFTDQGRGKAPMFQGETRDEKIDAAITWEIRNAPWYFDNGRRGLYVWDCDNPECGPEEN